jgi:hypothetical protein
MRTFGVSFDVITTLMLVTIWTNSCSLQKKTPPPTPHSYTINDKRRQEKMEQSQLTRSLPPLGKSTSSSTFSCDDIVSSRRHTDNVRTFKLSTDTTKLPKSCLRRPFSDNKLLLDDVDNLTVAAAAKMIPSKLSSASSSFVSKPPPKNVSFHKIEIAEHEYELGDNPSCITGCPIQIGWEPLQKIALDVEEYEDLRSTNLKRNREQLRIPPIIRDHLAKQAGATRSEVQQATQQARLISISRTRSIKAQPWDKIHYRLELTSRALRKVTSVDGIKLFSRSSLRWSSSSDLRGPTKNVEGRHDDTRDEPQQVWSEDDRMKIPFGIPNGTWENNVERGNEDEEEPLSF